MDRKIIRVGLIGSGMIGKVHARTYQALASQKDLTSLQPELLLLSQPDHPVRPAFLEGLNPIPLAGSPAEFFAARPDVVDICTPNDAHLPYVDLAGVNNTPIYCEKPLGKDLAEAAHMAALAQEKGLLTQVAFVYRYLPAIQQMIEAYHTGQIGRANHFRITMFHAGYLDPQRPLSWRLKKEIAGGGVLSDLGIHIIDILRAVLGEVAWVQCECKTFIGERPAAKGSLQKQAVDVDDWSVCTLGTTGGACGTLEVSRVASGRHQQSIFEIFGEKGSLAFDYFTPNQASLYLPEVGEWKPLTLKGQTERLPVSSRLFAKAQNYEETFFASHVACIEDFLSALQQGKPTPVNFANGLRDQAVLEAAYRSSRSAGTRVAL